ncbi:UDP-N-acetylmuramoyl-L-alanine--D-glutamate ligase [Capnocytophaga ochracea F0287]|uniref:UDP-N-acetylmuramoylalanine--D-glutamate ligase n=1 Tax=Capnocytophaga ochracea F0287 TaxID=873517 RepID=E4MV02_CAPOC|nr:UDP-N-acetylmuramoyl-L-alanine--D-glutamate ligase [Capnocytophaga ochracea]EFS96446.1 UDP-N-acetylmuramoyl-L-alanine--D-glutamate ligase [Capnocytophaga ochracea F0287]EJF44795.1 UDP-N-acetylmuramoyl-L-alanine--D-glutamate ligase [Capnocytophaga ochracea str. Holt 25]UEB42959.1 UDP-N-acetylmuramoyl-L-alanine--D-glutamate ligase [Capnocytophaga ochracea]
MKRLVILGGGESGVGTAILGKQKGWEVFLSDKGSLKPHYRETLNKEGIQWEEGTHTEEKILLADVIMKSPGIPDKAPIIKKVHEKGIAVISEIEFASQYTDSLIVGITGSNGKTTTTLLTYHIFKEAGLQVGLGGNIGYSFAELVATENPPYYVLEISSFQLDGIEHFAPHIAVLLNITPDHLDRYDYKFENYINSKFRIAMNQTENDYLIYDADDEVITQWLSTHTIKSKLIPFSIEKELPQGAFLKDNKIYIMLENQTTEIDVEEISLRGKHNIKNTMAASVAARLVNIRNNSLRESLKGFKGAPHRLEEVKVVDGVTYVNDSKATNVNSVFYALDTIKTPIVWIVGGQDKGNDYNSLLPYVHEKVRAIVCLGVDNTPIIQSFYNTIGTLVETRSMDEAVKLAQGFAQEGDTVLLSPACASFDLFKNYEERGDLFKAAVQKL